eukprot:snap_masked-scaffold_28-processed-gene-2.16-mRNA-1 protein AED:0.29 eAED:0.29 QI:0/-1/0/1/-1/1/1/0/139
MASIGGHIILLNGTPIIWKTKKQDLIAQSSTKAETIGVSRGLSTLKWCTNILKFLRMKTPKVTVFSDNHGAIKLLEGQTISGRSRHIDIKYFVTSFELKRNSWKIKYTEAGKNLADIITKSVNKVIFKNIVQKLMNTLK